jgi:hypothetical protein
MKKRCSLLTTLALNLALAGSPVRAQTTPPQPEKKPQPAQGSTCEGALEIVPAKVMTFPRKRRPARAGEVQAESKPKPDGSRTNRQP